MTRTNSYSTLGLHKDYSCSTCVSYLPLWSGGLAGYMLDSREFVGQNRKSQNKYAKN